MSAQPRPGTLRRLARAGAGVLAAAALAFGAWQGYEAVMGRPIERVIYAGDVERLSYAELETLAGAIQGAAPPRRGLAEIREAARRLGWVRDATVRRQFPDAVIIRFEAHQALARWDDERLVSTDGAVFPAAQAPAPLPRFRGPEGSAPVMVEAYPAIARALAPLADPVRELRLSRRGAWQVVLESGLTLHLGRGDAAGRLQRFAAAWPQLATRRPDYVDLRYPNGFAVRRAAVLDVVKPRTDR